MDSVDAPWLGPHEDIYGRILADLRANPVSGSPADFLNGRAMQLLTDVLARTAYMIDGQGRAEYVAGPPDGTRAIFWNGQELGLKPYNAKTLAFSDFELLAQRIMRLAPSDAFIVDLGAGTSIQSVVLRAQGCTLPVLSLDLFPSALEIGRILCSSLRLKDISFGAFNLTIPAQLSRLRDELPKNRPIILLSRQVLYPFFDEADYTRLFDFFINEVHAYGGIHLERTGRFTPAFQKIQSRFGSELPIPPKHRDKRDDPLSYLATRPDISVQERIEIWPHYVETYFPSYLSWLRRPAPAAR